MTWLYHAAALQQRRTQTLSRGRSCPDQPELGWSGDRRILQYTNLLLPLAPQCKVLASPLSGGTDAGQRSGAAAAEPYLTAEPDAGGRSRTGETAPSDLALRGPLSATCPGSTVTSSGAAGTGGGLLPARLAWCGGEPRPRRHRGRRAP